MTPKEKAIKLVDKYYNLFSVELENTIDYRESKQCALIAVYEMLLEHFADTSEYADRRYYYLIEVKQEIELL